MLFFNPQNEIIFYILYEKKEGTEYTSIRKCYHIGVGHFSEASGTSNYI